jgi:hypothetical protein
MSEAAPTTDLRAGIARWQQKHGIADSDPALACLELFDLYVASLRARSAEGPPLRFEEFRSTLELLDARSKTFTKHAADLTHELRQSAQTQSQLRQINALAFGLTAAATFTAGLLIGIFVW